MENQEQVWDSIAKPWKKLRITPIQEVVEFLKNKKGRILDLGCGNGKHFPYMKGQVYGVDFSENMLKFSRELAEKNQINANLIKSEAYNLPFEDNFFDAVIFVAVLHCVDSKEKREKALKELLRVLKSGKEAFITVWDYNQERFKDNKKESYIPWKYDGKEYMRYYYLYDKEEFLDLLKDIGFEILQANNSENPNGFYSKKNIDVIVKKP